MDILGCMLSDIIDIDASLKRGKQLMNNSIILPNPNYIPNNSRGISITRISKKKQLQQQYNDHDDNIKIGYSPSIVLKNGGAIDFLFNDRLVHSNTG